MKHFNTKHECDCRPAMRGIGALLSKLRGMTPKERARYLRDLRAKRGF